MRIIFFVFVKYSYWFPYDKVNKNNLITTIFIFYLIIYQCFIYIFTLFSLLIWNIYCLVATNYSILTHPPCQN